MALLPVRFLPKTVFKNAIHILNRLDMRVHQVPTLINHAYSKIWVNRDRVICFLVFFGDFWGREPDLHSEFSDFQNLSVFSNFLAWNHIVCHRYRQEKVQNTFFNTLEPLWKSALNQVNHTQLSGTSATASYLQYIYNTIYSIYVLLCIPSLQRFRLSKSLGGQSVISLYFRCIFALYLHYICSIVTIYSQYIYNI